MKTIAAKSDLAVKEENKIGWKQINKHLLAKNEEERRRGIQLRRDAAKGATQAMVAGRRRCK